MNPEFKATYNALITTCGGRERNFLVVTARIMARKKATDLAVAPMLLPELHF
jgi:hypothetical protein